MERRMYGTFFSENGRDDRRQLTKVEVKVVSYSTQRRPFGVYLNTGADSQCVLILDFGTVERIASGLQAKMGQYLDEAYAEHVAWKAARAREADLRETATPETEEAPVLATGASA